jgi:hypothetical protein
MLKYYVVLVMYRELHYYLIGTPAAVVLILVSSRSSYRAPRSVLSETDMPADPGQQQQQEMLMHHW